MRIKTQYATCTWPNGEKRRVRHRFENGVFTEGINPIFWIDDGSKLYNEDVPFEWLSEFGVNQGSKKYNITK